MEMNPGGLIFISVSSKGKWPNTGTYQCIAKNDLGTAVSRNASVQIASKKHRCVDMSQKELKIALA